MSVLLALCALLPVAYGLWWLFRDYVLPSPLDNIPGPASTSIIAGNMSEMFTRNNWAFMQKLRDTYGPVTKINGFLGSRWLHVWDVRALHSILVKDAELFHKSAAGNIASEIILGPGLFATEGARHKRQRKMLNPVFSAAHMRNMTPFFHSIVAKLREALESRVADGQKEIDISGWMGRTALELIGQGALGHSFDPLTEETSDEFTEAVKALVPHVNENEWLRAFVTFIPYLGPAWFRRKLLDLVPIRSVQRLKYITDVLTSRSAEILRERKEAMIRGDETLLLNRVGAGKDVMSVLLKANLDASEEDRMPDVEMLGQMSTFILAGVDTTSNSLARILHLLSIHQDVQDKLRAELVEAQEQYGDKMPYNELSQLPYMDAVCRETMRLYSPVSFSIREARQGGSLPLTEPIRGLDGKLMSEIPVPKGTLITLDLQAVNTNKELWGEDALEWKPERWLKPAPASLEEARIPGIYSNLMTFSAGGYSCIGFKFSQLEMKVVLSTLVRSFKFDLPEKPITWNFGGVNFPTMDTYDSTRSEMFLKVKLAKD
ncbi:cytochrome P450 [Trametes polyzona]|nr:cytochrome P450 [Trametes polyzona]